MMLMLQKGFPKSYYILSQPSLIAQLSSKRSVFLRKKLSVRLKKWGSGHTLDHTNIDDSSNTCIIFKRKKIRKLNQIKK